MRPPPRARRAAFLAALLAGLAAAVPAGAAVLGARQIGIGIGTTWPGDVTIDRNTLDFSAQIRLPVAPFLDIGAFHEQAMAEGRGPDAEGAPRVKEKSTAYGVEFTGHFLPRRAVDPFVSFTVSNATADTVVDGTPIYVDERLVFLFRAGAEINLSGKLSLLFGATYADSFKDPYESDLSASLTLNAWVMHPFLVGVGAAGSFDTRDLSAFVNCAYAF